MWRFAHLRVRARLLVLFGIALVLLIGWLPLPDALLRPLEMRYRPPQGRLDEFVGMVVLGGELATPRPLDFWGNDPFRDPSERLTVPLALMRQYPHLQFLYAGREKEVTLADGSTANIARYTLTKLGLDGRRAMFEEASRNTYENAVLAAKLPGVDKQKSWLLVTSARHMPRAFASFAAAGWNVTPYPVDYLTKTRTAWTEYSIADGIVRWESVLHEYLGLLAYRMLGRIG
jgi:uncharacterized SAM-binding protein YcdF (DUF218 family)